MSEANTGHSEADSQPTPEPVTHHPECYVHAGPNPGCNCGSLAPEPRPNPVLYRESDVMMFIGYLSGAVPALHYVEVPRLRALWDEFCKRAGLPQPGEPV
jgi:hypothetical protein